MLTWHSACWKYSMLNNTACWIRQHVQTPSDSSMLNSETACWKLNSKTACWNNTACWKLKVNIAWWKHREYSMLKQIQHVERGNFHGEMILLWAQMRSQRVRCWASNTLRVRVRGTSLCTRNRHSSGLWRMLLCCMPLIFRRRIALVWSSTHIRTGYTLTTHTWRFGARGSMSDWPWHRGICPAILVLVLWTWTQHRARWVDSPQTARHVVSCQRYPPHQAVLVSQVVARERAQSQRHWIP